MTHLASVIPDLIQKNTMDYYFVSHLTLLTVYSFLNDRRWDKYYLKTSIEHRTHTGLTLSVRIRNNIN